MYLPPDGGLIASIAASKMTWETAFGEWIDNAFDAGANTVSIEFVGNTLLIRDDGHGCENPTHMVRLGSHSKQSSTRLGRYGIGGKDAALWVGGTDSTISIRTEHKGMMRTFQVNWKEYGASQWNVEDPTEEQAPEDSEYHTEIRIIPAKKPPHGEDWRERLSTLGYLYSAAIKKGRQIKLKRATKGAHWEPLVRWELPTFDGAIVDARISVNGRGARVYCGVVRSGELNPRAGFTYSHEWRVIEQASANGCGGFSSARVCGFVDLDDSWPLNKNKDGVSKDADALYLAVEAAALPVLERAHCVGVELQSRQFTETLNATLNDLLQRRAKAKRDVPKNRLGTKEPTNTGGKHTRAQQEQDGDRFPSKASPSGRFVLDFRAFGKPSEMGEVKPPSQVLLNTDNPAVADFRHRNDMGALVTMAICLIGAAHCASSKPLLRDLPASGFSTSEFSRAVGSIMSAPLPVDGKPWLRVVKDAQAS